MVNNLTMPQWTVTKVMGLSLRLDTLKTGPNVPSIAVHLHF
jgi:hypothetical protein